MPPRNQWIRDRFAWWLADPEEGGTSSESLVGRSGEQASEAGVADTEGDQVDQGASVGSEEGMEAGETENDSNEQRHQYRHAHNTGDSNDDEGEEQQSKGMQVIALGAATAQNSDSALAPEILSAWESKIQQWSQDGSLLAAAREALMLPGEPQVLKDLISQWSDGEFGELPPIVLLSGTDMNGALGAYAISTGKIYLNADWLAGATNAQVLAVLTEELGHHLDGLLNAVDTPGDEGEYFADLLSGQVISDAQRHALQNGGDSGIAMIEETLIPVEQAATRGTSIWALNDGSSIVTGDFYDTASFGSTTLTADVGKANNFVAKLNADGSYAWATQAAATSLLSINNITTLSDGSSLIIGTFEGLARFGSTTLDSYIPDVFVAKLNANGSYAWATQAGAPTTDAGYSITALSDGSSLITGYFAGRAVFGGNVLNSAGSGSIDIFIAKLNANGSYAWATQAGGIDSDIGYSITALSDGSSLITGTFQGVARFGNTTLTSDGKNDIFVAKLNADGSYAWATRAGGTLSDNGISIKALSDGSSLITGSFAGIAKFGSTTLISAGTTTPVTGTIGNADVFVAKLNADGSYAWATTAGGTLSDNGSSIKALSDGSSLITGTFQGTASFGSTTLTSAGINDIFVAKLNANGSYVWATRAGGALYDSPYEITALSDGSSLITGSFEGTASFGNTTLTSVTGTSIFFVAKLNADGVWSSAWTTTQPDVPNIYLAVSPASVTEDGIANLIYTFTRTGPTTSALTVNYTVGGTATLGTDYTGINTTGTTSFVTFTAGSATATVTVDPTADTTSEADETVALTLATGTGYTIGTPTAVSGTIIDVPNIYLAVSPASVTEDGIANLIYTFTRTGPTTSALTVNYTVGGTATLGTDYTGINTTGTTSFVTFTAGSATATVTVDPTADTTSEADETVALTLATGTGYTIGTPTAVSGTISNDDGPVITLAVSPASVTEDGIANLIYTFTRTGPTTSALTVNYTVGGTATLGTDYTGINTTGTTSFVTFTAGSATATVTVDPTADTTSEADETVALTLATGTGYTIGTPTAVSGTISNDDGDIIPPTITGITVTGNQVLLQFSEALNTTNLPTAARFTIRVGGVIQPISALYPGNASQLLVTLAVAVSGGQTVTVAYTDLTAANDLTGVVQDLAGNDMATTPIPRNATTYSSATTVTSLAANYTNLILTGANAINGTGNDLANVITGNTAANVITGGAGTDIMNGGSGSDLYLIAASTEHTAAEIQDTGATIGEIDELRFASVTANDTLIVFAGDTGLERVVIGTGTAAAALTTALTTLNINASAATNGLTITGNNGTNSLTGTAFADTLIGNAGNDLIAGGLGNDILTGGVGADIFRFDSVLNGTTNVDRITDFTPTTVATTTDRIQLENTGAGLFTGLTTTGTLAANAFVSGAAFTTAAQQIRYDGSTGNLFYDADGNGAQASILFATLNTGLAINNSHFVVT